MNNSHCIPCVTAIVLVACAGLQSAAAAQVACDRTCLKGFVDRYMQALAARNPRGLMMPLLPYKSGTGW